MPYPPATPTPTSPSCAVTAQTGCQESPVSAKRPLPPCFRPLVTSRLSARPSTPETRGSRERSAPDWGAAYLDVAPRVVRLAQDVPIPDLDFALPRAVADPALLSRLAVDYGLTNPFNRVLGALGIH